MKVQLEQNPEGFDYSNIIEVLSEPFLRLPLEQTRIQVEIDYPATECGHMTTLSISEKRTFLAFDLLYNRVHAWCGPGVNQADLFGDIVLRIQDLQIGFENAIWSF